MFFAIYALGDPSEPLIVPFPNTLTPNIGFLLFAAFHITNITVLISLLIAMLTTSYEAIQVLLFSFFFITVFKLFIDKILFKGRC